MPGELIAKALEKRRAKVMAHELDSPEVDRGV